MSTTVSRAHAPRSDSGRRFGLPQRIRSLHDDRRPADVTTEQPPSNAWVVLWGLFCVVIVAQTVVINDGTLGRLKPFHLVAAVCTVAALLLLPERWRRLQPATVVFWSLAIAWGALMVFVSVRNSLGPEGVQQLLVVLLAIGPALIFRYLVKTGTRGQLIVLQCAPLLGFVGLGYTIQANSGRTGIGVIDAVRAVASGNPSYVISVVYRRGLTVPGNTEIVRANIRHLIFIALAVLVWTVIYTVAESRRRGIRLAPWLTTVSVGVATIMIATSTSRSSLLILALPLVGLVGRLFTMQKTTLAGNKVIAGVVVAAAMTVVFFSSFLEGSLVGRVLNDTASYQERLVRLGLAFQAATQAGIIDPAPPVPSPHNLILGTIGSYGWIAGLVGVAVVIAIIAAFVRAELRYLATGDLLWLAVAGLCSAAFVRAFTAGDNGLPLSGIIGVLIATLVAPTTTAAPASHELADANVGRRLGSTVARTRRPLTSRRSRSDDPRVVQPPKPNRDHEHVDDRVADRVDYRVADRVDYRVADRVDYRVAGRVDGHVDDRDRVTGDSHREHESAANGPSDENDRSRDGNTTEAEPARPTPRDRSRGSVTAATDRPSARRSPTGGAPLRAARPPRPADASERARLRNTPARLRQPRAAAENDRVRRPTRPPHRTNNH